MRMRTLAPCHPGWILQLFRQVSTFPPPTGCPVLGLRATSQNHILQGLPLMQSHILQGLSGTRTATCWDPSPAHPCSLCLHLLLQVPKSSALHPLRGPHARPGRDCSVNELSSTNPDAPQMRDWLPNRIVRAQPTRLKGTLISELSKMHNIALMVG